jgi:hypothetical protein
VLDIQLHAAAARAVWMALLSVLSVVYCACVCVLELDAGECVCARVRGA